MANVNDIITLARAGYTAEQISVILNASAQPVQQIPAQPVQQIPAQTNDPVLEQLRQLTGLVQMNNINGSTMPAKQSADDIVASIINPPVKKQG